jgi:hypothetical protein
VEYSRGKDQIYAKWTIIVAVIGSKGTEKILRKNIRHYGCEN